MPREKIDVLNLVRDVLNLGFGRLFREDDEKILGLLRMNYPEGIVPQRGEKIF